MTDALRSWQVTFRVRSDLGVADFVKRIEAKDSGWAHALVFESLKANYPDTYDKYTFMSAVRI